MKHFFSTLIASFIGCCIALLITVLVSIGFIGAIASLTQDTPPVIPSEGILKLDFKTVVAERPVMPSALDIIQGNTTGVTSIITAVKAIDNAATDPRVKFIYMTPDNFAGSITAAEEIRNALIRFRNTGKAVISYTQMPGLGSFYLASASDKVYMAPFGNGMFLGLSSNMIYFKDLLDKLGINIQLIRHGKYKSAGEPFISSKMSEENRRQNEEMLQAIWETMGGSIAKANEISLEDLDRMLNNLELGDAEDFLEKGLVDGLMHKDEMTEQLCTLYNVSKEDDLKFIPFADYAKSVQLDNFKSKNRVAVIYANGEIVDTDDPSNIGGDQFSATIAQVRKDTTIRAIVLRVNSPGGSVTAAEKIKREIDLLREEGRTVIASYGNYAASGGYWISAEADYIFSNATTLTGSIGVFSMIPDLGKAANKIANLNIYSVKTHDHADMYSLMRALDKDELRFMQASVDTIYSKFTNIVAEGRDMTVADVDAIAQGRVWAGSEALEIGLVDSIGGIWDAIAFAATAEGYTDYGVVEYPKSKTQMELLMEELTSFTATVKSPLKTAYEAMSAETGKAIARIPYDYEFNL